MDDCREQEPNRQDRADLDRRWQEDMAWLEMSGGVPSRQCRPSDGWVGSLEKKPVVWAIILLALGGVAFLLVAWTLF